MKKKIFYSTFIISITAMIAMAVAIMLIYGNVIGKEITDEEVVTFFVIVVLALVLFGIGIYIIAKRNAHYIIGPLQKIDLDSGKLPNVEGYEEVKPLLSRIRRQNVMIETNIRDIKREYAKRENFRRDFTANVSHELKTPLTSISGISEMLMNGIIKPEDIPEFAENINKEAGRLINLVNDIILISKLESEELSVQKEKVDIVSLAYGVKKRLEVIAMKKKVSLDVVSEGEIYVIGVSNMLEEMIFNLCDNAIKYNVSGGSVKVFIEEGERNIKIIVEDTGIGIADEDKDSIFERFYRVDKSRSKDVGGTGLGLSIVKHIAIYHNGHIKAYDGQNGGTKMVATIRK